MLVNLPNAAVLVALVQIADCLPDVLFGLVGGVCPLDGRPVFRKGESDSETPGS